jgi:hypothetical protein
MQSVGSLLRQEPQVDKAYRTARPEGLLDSEPYWSALPANIDFVAFDPRARNGARHSGAGGLALRYYCSLD